MNIGRQRGMTPEDITRIRWLSDVQMSGSVAEKGEKPR